jgi:hypothetical protein
VPRRRAIEMIIIMVHTVEESMMFNQLAIYISVKGIPIIIIILTRNLTNKNNSRRTNLMVCRRFLIA